MSQPGEITLLVPEGDQIHQMDDFADWATVEIHVHGKDNQHQTQKWNNCQRHWRQIARRPYGASDSQPDRGGQHDTNALISGDHSGQLAQVHSANSGPPQKTVGEITSDEFDAVADQEVLAALRLQEDAGVDIVTDGEQRRDNFYSFAVDKLSGCS